MTLKPSPKSPSNTPTVSKAYSSSSTQKRHSFITLNAALMLMGATPLFAKLISLPALHITMLRTLFAATALFIFAYFSKTNLRLNKNQALTMLVTGTILAAHWVTAFQAIKVSSVAIYSVAFRIYPLVVVLLEPVLLQTKLRPINILLAFLGMLCILVITPNFSLSNSITQGMLWTILSASLYALRAVLNRKVVQELSSVSILFYQVLVTTVLLSPVMLLQPLKVSSYQWLMLIVLGVFLTAIPHTLFTLSLRHLEAKSVSIMNNIQIIYNIFFAALILHEYPSGRVYIGAFLIMLIILYEAWQSKVLRFKAISVPRA